MPTFESPANRTRMPSMGNDELIAWSPWYRARRRGSTRGRSRALPGGVLRGGERGNPSSFPDRGWCRELDELDVGADGDGERTLTLIEGTVDRVGHAAGLWGDLQRRCDGAEGALWGDAAPLVDRRELGDEAGAASMDRQHAEPFDVVVGAVVELEAEADLPNGRRADPDEDGPLERLAVDLDGPLEALEEFVNERAVDQSRTECAQEQPGCAGRPVLSGSVVLAEEVGHEAVTEDEAQGVADPQAAPPDRLELLVGPHRPHDRCQKRPGRLTDAQ